PADTAGRECQGEPGRIQGLAVDRRPAVRRWRALCQQAAKSGQTKGRFFLARTAFRPRRPAAGWKPEIILQLSLKGRNPRLSPPHTTRPSPPPPGPRRLRPALPLPLLSAGPSRPSDIVRRPCSFLGPGRPFVVGPVSVRR